MENIFRKKGADEEHQEEKEVTSEKIPSSQKTSSNGCEKVNIVDLKNVTQIYENPQKITIFDNFNMEIEDIAGKGQFVTIMGASGCGKSTILRYISGLQNPTSGEVMIYGNPRNPDKKIPMVFQAYSSFEWKTVLQNVALPLLIQGMSEIEANKRAMEMIEIVGLNGHENKWAKVPILSGGQLQRVAIARNLVANSQILLMDEPNSGLDIVTRKHMQIFFRSVFENAKIDPTVILVTHSESEAVFLSSDIYLLDANPATIKHHIKIDLPDIRDNSVRKMPEFTKYVNQVTDLMEELGAKKKK